MREQSGLVRTGRLFGGLLNDLKRKKPFYVSDFLDGFHPQCISSFLFLYFACLAPVIAFGALLGEATGNRIATIESLMSGLISGVLYGLFAGQPLTLLGSTGPVYVFEKILYSTCEEQNWDYLSLRLWIGLWVALFLVVLVALDASAYVCYITRFTEEMFATLIAFIFIYNAFKNIIEICSSVTFAPENSAALNCSCNLANTSDGLVMGQGSVAEERSFSRYPTSQCLDLGGTLVGSECDFQPNVALMSIILFSGSYLISSSLKSFRTSDYLPGYARNFLASFAATIAIVAMTLLDYLAGVKTPKLTVPDSFKPTWEGRDWMVTHALIFADHFLANPWWVDMFLAPLFALLATILIFMDQQITSVIVNRKEHNLQKGCGYHLDLFVLALIIVVLSVFGLPWFVAATVLSINHLQSLMKESQCKAPGEKPQFLGIREQRVTAVAISVCIGLSYLMVPILSLIPMPVLFGVFLFMGMSALKGLQFFQRLLLFFMPTKFQPEYIYLKYVPLVRVHMFTIIQLTTLIVLWIIKNNSTTSISFPVMLVVICGIRKALECVFSKKELRALDDLLPEINGNKTRKSRLNMDTLSNHPSSGVPAIGGDLMLDTADSMIPLGRTSGHHPSAGHPVVVLGDHPLGHGLAMASELDALYSRVVAARTNGSPPTLAGVRSLIGSPATLLRRRGRPGTTDRNGHRLEMPAGLGTFYVGDGVQQQLQHPKGWRPHQVLPGHSSRDDLSYYPLVSRRPLGVSPPTSPPQPLRRTVFVRLEGQAFFAPMHFSDMASSVRELLGKLEAALRTDEFRAAQVGHVFQRILDKSGGGGGLLFKVDDEMVADLFQPREVFTIHKVARPAGLSEEDEAQYDITLVQEEASRDR